MTPAPSPASAAPVQRAAALPLASLEGLRFLSSIAIVAGHYIPYAWSERWISRLHLAVDLFFVISGIVIAERYGRSITTRRAWLAFMTRRVGRLYPLHLATLAFFIAIGVLVWTGALHPRDATRYNPAMIVPNLLMVQAWWPGSVISFNYVSWSISAEFFVYLVYPLLMFAFGGPMWRALALVAVTLAAAAAIAEWGMGMPLTKLSWNFGILRALPGFAFGVWLCSHAPRLSAMVPPARARQALCVLMVAVGVLMVWRQSQLLTLLVIWAMVAAAYLCDRAQLATWVSVRWLSVNGRLTYSIYMLHTVVATVLLTFLFPRLLGTGDTARAVSVLLALPALYLASVASLRWFEDPLRAAIGRVGDRRFGRDAPRSPPVQFQKQGSTDDQRARR